MRLFLLVFVFIFVPLSAFAADDVQMEATDRGSAIGTIIPSELDRVDQHGAPRQFDDLVGENGMVLMFIRSAKWCPFCKRQLMDVSANVDEIHALGYALVILSYDSVEDIQRYVAEHEPKFTMLSDPSSTVIDAFGLRNANYPEMHFAHGVPHPMIFIIGPDKIIQDKLAEHGYRDRPPTEAVIHSIQAMGQ